MNVQPHHHNIVNILRQIDAHANLYEKKANLKTKLTFLNLCAYIFCEIKLFFEKRLGYLSTKDTLAGHVKELTSHHFEANSDQKLTDLIDKIEEVFIRIKTPEMKNIKEALSELNTSLIQQVRTQNFNKFKDLFDSFNREITHEQIKEKVCDVLAKEGTNKSDTQSIKIKDDKIKKDLGFGEEITVPNLMVVDIGRSPYIQLNKQPLIDMTKEIPKDYTHIYESLLQALKQDSKINNDEILQELSWIGALMSQALRLDFLTELQTSMNVSQFPINLNQNISQNTDEMKSNLFIALQISPQSIQISIKQTWVITSMDKLDEQGQILRFAYVNFSHDITLPREELHSIQKDEGLQKALQSTNIHVEGKLESFPTLEEAQTAIQIANEKSFE